MENIRRFLPAAVLLFLAGVYWECFSRTLFSGVHEDPTRLMDSALEFGVAHSNGYPTFVLLLRFLSLLVPSHCYIAAANFSSACFALGSLGFAYVLFRRLGVGRGNASASLVLLGTFPIFWSQSVFLEVYQFTHLLFVLQLLALIRAIANPSGKNAAILGLLCGLQLTHHLLASAGALFTALSFLVITWKEKEGRGPRILCAVLGGLAGLVPYLYLPLSWWNSGLGVGRGVSLMKVGTPPGNVYPSEVGIATQWKIATRFLLEDFGIVAIVCAAVGWWLAISSRNLERRAAGWIAGVGGFLVPFLFLMGQRPWKTPEVMAFYAFPFFCLSLFIPLALQALRERFLGQGAWKKAALPAFVLLLAWVQLREGYPRFKQSRGDLRYVAVSETLAGIAKNGRVLSYSVFGSYESWGLLASLEGIDVPFTWNHFSESPHRDRFGPEKGFEEFMEAARGMERPYYVLTDSPSVVETFFDGTPQNFSVVREMSSHETPTIAHRLFYPNGPRTWLDAITGRAVYELDYGFTSGHQIKNLAFDWTLKPIDQVDGKLVASNEFASERLSRQRFFTLSADFEKENEDAQIIPLYLDPLNGARPIRTWNFKERISLPFHLDARRNEPGFYRFGKAVLSAPFDPSANIEPIVHTLFRISE